MLDYKLVVVSAFEGYEKGDQILDPVVVSRILDEKDIMHEYSNNVRRVLKNEIEKQMYVAPVPANQAPASSQNKSDVNAASLKIESIKADK